jgi:hypothetical protein
VPLLQSDARGAEHVLIVADPQVLDHRSYPERGPALTAISQYMTDMQLRKGWWAATRRLRPDRVIFLGMLGKHVLLLPLSLMPGVRRRYDGQRAIRDAHRGVSALAHVHACCSGCRSLTSMAKIRAILGALQAHLPNGRLDPHLLPPGEPRHRVCTISSVLPPLPHSDPVTVESIVVLTRSFQFTLPI